MEQTGLNSLFELWNNMIHNLKTYSHCVRKTQNIENKNKKKNDLEHNKQLLYLKVEEKETINNITS